MRLNRLGGTELPGHTQALLSESSVGKQKKQGTKWWMEEVWKSFVKAFSSVTSECHIIYQNQIL